MRSLGDILALVTGLMTCSVHGASRPFAAQDSIASPPATTMPSSDGSAAEFFNGAGATLELAPSSIVDSESSHGRLFAAEAPEGDQFWYLDLGLRVGYTRLESTNDQLNRRLELPLKLDAVGIFDHPTTPLDRKTEFGLTTSYIGIGRRETKWLTWNFYFGSGIGADRDHQRAWGLRLNADFKYALYYTGITADVYPWGIPALRDERTIWQRLRASRPYALAGFEVGYLRARGSGSFRAGGLPLYADDQRVDDWLVSYLLGLGWEFPITRRWGFNLSAHYSFHFYRPEELNSWNVVFAIRYRF